MEYKNVCEKYTLNKSVHNILYNLKEFFHIYFLQVFTSILNFTLHCILF